uniref:Ig-like domain-containing protein n=1 Tax=Gasterosteus aculeatus aculeatus TaxID=481459 RepID=A0AAQ4R4X7_GASAC
MVAQLLGLAFLFLACSPVPSKAVEVQVNPNWEVVYQNTDVYGVLGKAVILECGTTLPDIYIWSFTKPGTDAIKAVVYNLGKGQRLQQQAQTLGQLSVISNSAAVSIEQLPVAAQGLFTCQAFYDIEQEPRVFYYFVYLTVRVPVSKPHLLMSDVSPVEGSSVWMRCHLENGTGPIQYAWQHETSGGNISAFALGNASVINVTDINRNHTGWYRCVASNAVNSESSDRLWLNTFFGPDVPRIDVSPYSITERGYSALERDTVSLQCQAQSNPASQYVWFYNESQIYTGPQLTITKILRMHTGDYACLAQNTYLNTRSKKSISLTVYFGPDVPRIDVSPYSITERGYSALEGDTVSLLCEAQSNPASQYVWFHNNSQIHTGPQLTITKILRMHTGDYACLAQNTYLNTRSKKSISLTVYYPPDGNPTCSVEPALNHTALRLLCSWPGGLPSPSLHWTGPLPSEAGQDGADTRLQTNPLANTAILLSSEDLTSNSSLYTCRGSHLALKQSTECSARTYIPPAEPLCFAYVTNNKEYLMLSCTWDGGAPKALVWWEGPGVQGKGGEENSNILILRYGTARGGKPYTCYAKHPLLVQTKTCRLTLEAPVLLTQRRVVSVYQGSDVQLNCTLRANYPSCQRNTLVQ